MFLEIFKKTIDKDRKILTFLLTLAFVFIPISITLSSSPDNELFIKINKSYYNLPREGLKGFYCRVRSIKIENLKTDLSKEPKDNTKKIDSLKAIWFVMRFDGKQFTVKNSGYNPTDDKTFDGAVSLLIDGSSHIISGTFKTLLSFLVNPMIDLKSRRLELTTNGDEYLIEESNFVSKINMKFDKKLKNTDTKITIFNQKFELIPEFTKTQKGYLIKNFKSKDMFTALEYKKEQNYLLPAKLTVFDQEHSKRTLAEFNFYDYTIENLN